MVREIKVRIPPFWVTLDKLLSHPLLHAAGGENNWRGGITPLPATEAFGDHLNDILNIFQICCSCPSLPFVPVVSLS